MIEDLNPKQFKDYLDNNTAILVDVREQGEIDICKIDGSISMPMSKGPEQYDELNPSDNVAIYCHHGMRSLQIAEFLESKGYESLFNLQGGIDAWSREIDPSVDTY